MFLRAIVFLFVVCMCCLNGRVCVQLCVCVFVRFELLFVSCLIVCDWLVVCWFVCLRV